MKRLLRQSFRVTGTILGAFGFFILLEIGVQAFGGGSHPVASWAIVQLGKIFRPVGHWFITAPDWAWISMIMVLGVPTTLLFTWALDVSGIGIKTTHKARWAACIWILIVTFACAGIHWARMGGAF
jgi:hypothetical protein